MEHEKRSSQISEKLRLRKIETAKAWNKAHPDQTKLHKQKWKIAHPDYQEQANVYLREWREINPESEVANQARRRARIVNAPGSYAIKEWRELKARYDYTCLCCGRKEPEIKLTPDHIIPLAKEGTNDIANIQPLCQSCNSRKKDKIIDFRA